MREWIVQTKKGAKELWHGIGRWVALFSLLGCSVGVLVSIIVIHDYPPVIMYVGIVLGSLFVAWVWFFHRKQLPHELEVGDA